MTMPTVYAEISPIEREPDSLADASLMLTIVTALTGPTALTIIGFINLDNCPDQKFIPICLIGLGLTILIRFLYYLLTLWWRKYVKKDSYSTSSEPTLEKIIIFLLNLLVVTWIAVGAAFTYDLRCDSSENCIQELHSFCYYFYMFLCIFIALAIIAKCIYSHPRIRHQGFQV